MSVNTDFCKINNFSKTLSIQEFPNYVANVIFETFFNAPHFLSAIEDDFSVSRNNKTLEFIDAFVITEKYHGFHDLYIKTYNDKHDEETSLEVIDVDAYTGGFNLQIAYSTGFTAGKLE